MQSMTIIISYFGFFLYLSEAADRADVTLFDHQSVYLTVTQIIV